MMPQHFLLCCARSTRLKGVNENSKYSNCFFVLLPWYVRGLSNLVLELRHVEDHHRSSWGLNSAWKLQYLVWYLYRTCCCGTKHKINVRNGTDRYVRTYVAQSWRAHLRPALSVLKCTLKWSLNSHSTTKIFFMIAL